MLKNYFKIAWRNLIRNKVYGAINVLGLSLGIACCILIFTLVSYHLSFDSFHKNKDRIYRVVMEWHEDQVSYSPAVPTPLGKAFCNDYTAAEKTARVVDYRDVLISINTANDVRKFKEESGIVYAEPAFFSIFDFPLVKGNITTILKNPGEAVITEKVAKKYFGDVNDAIGKTIKVNNKTDFIVSGILKDIPANTDRGQEIYLSYGNLKDHNKWLANDSSWGSVYSGSQFFVVLKKGITTSSVNNSLKAIGKKYLSGRDVQTVVFKLQPLSTIHFNPDFGGYANKKYLWALFFVGLFLIITACVNFVNLATAQALNRSKEIGIRKVLGSLRSQLFWQFITETALITMVAALIAYGLSILAMPYMNSLFKEQIPLRLFSSAQLIIFLFTVITLVIFLSGFYPGLVLARFQPVLALKSKLSQKHIGGFSLRRVLVVTQFAISQMLIIGTIIIASQMHYSTTSNLGFSKESIVMLPVPVNDLSRMSMMRAKLARVPGVEKISFCYQAPASDANKSTNIRFDTRNEDEHWEVNIKAADKDYLASFNLKLVAGRNLYASDTIRECLVNETFIKKLNLSATPDIIGKTIRINGRLIPVVGVVKDFYNTSFHEALSPICILSDHKIYTNCAVKTSLKNYESSLASFSKIWNETYPEYLYSYQFLDERIAEFYELDNTMLKLIEVFAAIAVFIGCLGLYGLVSFMAVRKTKEIGVRKVLGASVTSILWMFSKEFSRLLLIAFIIAAPVAWWAMHKYLEDFTYRIKIGAGIFLLAILCTFVIAAITVSYQSLKSAFINPVKSLRSE